MAQEKFQYSGEGELFTLAAKVNAFCDVTPDTFYPAEHVAQAREIIAALAPRMTASSLVGLDVGLNIKGRRTIVRGATEHGEVSATDNDQIKREKSIIPAKEYRIGNYVVKGRSSRIKGRDTLVFEHFWERKRRSERLVTDTSYSKLVLKYSRENFQPEVISQLDYVPKTILFGPIVFSRSVANKTVIWKKE